MAESLRAGAVGDVAGADEDRIRGPALRCRACLVGGAGGLLSRPLRRARSSTSARWSGPCRCSVVSVIRSVPLTGVPLVVRPVSSSSGRGCSRRDRARRWRSRSGRLACRPAVATRPVGPPARSSPPGTCSPPPRSECPRASRSRRDRSCQSAVVAVAPRRAPTDHSDRRRAGPSRRSCWRGSGRPSRATFQMRASSSSPWKKPAAVPVELSAVARAACWMQVDSRREVARPPASCRACRRDRAARSCRRRSRPRDARRCWSTASCPRPGGCRRWRCPRSRPTSTPSLASMPRK